MTSRRCLGQARPCGHSNHGVNRQDGAYALPSLFFLPQDLSGMLLRGVDRQDGAYALPSLFFLPQDLSGMLLRPTCSQVSKYFVLAAKMTAVSPCFPVFLRLVRLAQRETLFLLRNTFRAAGSLEVYPPTRSVLFCVYADLASY
jgi:hypothetical protein